MQPSSLFGPLVTAKIKYCEYGPMLPIVVRIGPERVGMNCPDLVVDEISPASTEPIDASIAVVASHDVALSVAGNRILSSVCQLRQDPVDVRRCGVRDEPG